MMSWFLKMCSQQTLECEVEYVTDLILVSLILENYYVLWATPWMWSWILWVWLIEIKFFLSFWLNVNIKIKAECELNVSVDTFLFSKITAAAVAVPTQHVIVLTEPKHQECICADSSLALEKPFHQRQLATAVGTEWMCDGKTHQQVSVGTAKLGHMKARKSFALLLPTSTNRLSRLLIHYEDHACQEANQSHQ